MAKAPSHPLLELQEFPAAAARPRLLIEVPHGATSAAHFDAVRGLLGSGYPDDLREFFFVNTDVGAPETAYEVARALASGESGAGPIAVLVLRCLVPRTFIDVNRVLDAGDSDYAATGITPGVPDYVTDPEDRATLRALYERYQQAAREAYAALEERDGRALILHTYAPRSVDVGRIDAGIVGALREAYAPERYARWPRRPEVEIIDRAPDGTRLSPETLARAVEDAYAAIGIEVQRNQTYQLDPSTMGHRHATRHPGRVLCVELNRELLADPFDPFVEMRVSAAKARRMAAPLARALAAELG